MLATGRTGPSSAAGQAKAACSVSHLARAQRSTGRDRDRDAGAGRTTPGWSAGYRLALVDESDGGNARAGHRINRLVPASLADRNFFPHLEVRLPSRSPATGPPGTAGTGFSDLFDH